MKKKLDSLSKAKLIYSLELIAFSLVFLTIGILEMSQVIVISEKHKNIYNWITIFAAAFLIGELIFTLSKKQRRKNACWLDKFMVLPAVIFIITFDIICFILGSNVDPTFYQYSIPSLLIYLGIVFTFQGIYHYYHPLKEIIDEAKETDEKKNEENKEEKKN